MLKARTGNNSHAEVLSRIFLKLLKHLYQRLFFEGYPVSLPAMGLHQGCRATMKMQAS